MNIVFFGQRTAGAYVELAFFFGTATLVLAAYGSIIKKSGYSPKWVLLPASYFVLSVTLVFLLFFTTVQYAFGDRSIPGPATLDSYEALAYLDIALFVANVIGFFVFAFATWPIERDVMRLRRAGSRGERAGRPARRGGPSRPRSCGDLADPRAGTRRSGDGAAHGPVARTGGHRGDDLLLQLVREGAPHGRVRDPPLRLSLPRAGVLLHVRRRPGRRRDVLRTLRHAHLDALAAVAGPGVAPGVRDVVAGPPQSAPGFRRAPPTRIG